MKLMRILLVLSAGLPLGAAAESVFPLKLSGNRRYFVTQQDKPFLYHADTGWQIFTQLTTEEAVEHRPVPVCSLARVQFHLYLLAGETERLDDLRFAAARL